MTPVVHISQKVLVGRDISVSILVRNLSNVIPVVHNSQKVVV